MALVLIIIGTVMVIAAARDTVSGNSNDLVPLLESDFTGKDNYLYWIIAMMILGGVGYIPSMKNLSNAFLVLVLVVLFLTNGGFFSQFNSAIATTTNSATSTSGAPSTSGSTPSTNSSTPSSSGTPSNFFGGLLNGLAM